MFVRWWWSCLVFLSCGKTLQNSVIFDAFEWCVTAIAIHLDGQQLLAEQGKWFDIGRMAVRALDLLHFLLRLFCIISHTYVNLRAVASHRCQGRGCDGDQRFVSALKAAGTSISRPFRIGMILCR